MYSPWGGGKSARGNHRGVTISRFTVTLKEQVAEALALLAVQVTVVDPTGNVLPLGGVQTTDVTGALHVSTGPTVGAKVTTLPAADQV